MEQATIEEREDAVPQLLLTMTKAAEAMSISRVFLYQLVNRGEIHTIKLGTARRVPLVELQAFIQRKLELS